MFVVDIHNNIGRYCHVRGEFGRFVIKNAVKLKDFRGTVTHYLVKNLKTDKFLVVNLYEMTNVY